MWIQNCKWSLKVVPMVYSGLQSSFVSHAWPWSGRSLPNGSQWECWDPGLGSNVVRLPVLPPSDQPKAQSLIGWYFVTWLVGWQIAAGKLAGWLTAYWTKCQLYPPPGRHLVAMCDGFGHIDKMYPLVEISWPSVVLLWAGCLLVRCTPLPPHETLGQVCIWSDVRSGQHHVRCTPQLKNLSGHGKMTPHGWLLHHERPFTQEGNYLVPLCVLPPVILPNTC